MDDQAYGSTYRELAIVPFLRELPLRHCSEAHARMLGMLSRFSKGTKIQLLTGPKENALLELKHSYQNYKNRS